VKVFHPDIGMASNYGDISGEIAKVLDEFCMDRGLSWYSDSPFLFHHEMRNGWYAFVYDFQIINVASGQLDVASERLVKEVLLPGRVDFRPLGLEGCPVCRRTRISIERGNERWGETCPYCHNSKVFVYFVTSKQDVRLFCEARNFQRPPTYGSLLET
jgi:hypothetical protein